MRLSELLRRVPGLEKRFVYYLEAQGVIRPTRLPKARIDRRDYDEEDIGRIRRIWRYYRRGYALGAARELAQQDVGAEALVLLGTSARGRQEALEALKDSERVFEAAAIYGARADLLVRLEAARNEDVYEALYPAFEHGALVGVQEILRVRSVAGASRRCAERSNGRRESMLAFVLIRVPAKQVDRTLDRLRTLGGIVEASAVYGETDIIAKLDVPDQSMLDELIIRQIQGLPEVEATRTFIVVGGLHWKRA